MADEYDPVIVERIRPGAGEPLIQRVAVALASRRRAGARRRAMLLARVQLGPVRARAESANVGRPVPDAALHRGSAAGREPRPGPRFELWVATGAFLAAATAAIMRWAEGGGPEDLPD